MNSTGQNPNPFIGENKVSKIVIVRNRNISQSLQHKGYSGFACFANSTKAHTGDVFASLRNKGV